jgi:hypothetical protein
MLHVAMMIFNYGKCTQTFVSKYLKRLNPNVNSFGSGWKKTVKLIKKHDEFNPTVDPDFDEANYPPPYFIMNVVMQCASIPFGEVQDRYRRNVSVDDMMVEFFDRGKEPSYSFQFAKFTPLSPLEQTL